MTTDSLTDRPSVPADVLGPPVLAADETSSDVPPRAGPRPSVEWLLSLCTYLPLAALGFMPVWLHWSSQMNGCNCWDQLLLEWFVNWLPASIAHGHNVLATNYLYAPGGLNVMWNNSVFALGAVASPLTETIGVVHTFAVLLTISLALSASTMFLLLRRWTTWLPAAWLGGVVYGFSTLALEESRSGRINATFDAIPPLVVIVILKLVRKEWSPTVGGSVLGLLLTTQLFISEEMLTITLTCIGVTLAVLALVNRAEVLTHGAEVIRATVAAAVTLLVLSAYPLYVEFFGPDRITGPPESRAQLTLFSSDIASLVTPGVTQWLTFSWADRLSGSFTAARAAEVTEYIGLPLLVLLIATVVLLRRRTTVRIFALVGLAGLACSLGPFVVVANHQTHVPGPDSVLEHLPFLGDIMPSRWALPVWFSVAVLFALGLDAARVWVQKPVERVRGVAVTVMVVVTVMVGSRHTDGDQPPSAAEGAAGGRAGDTPGGRGRHPPHSQLALHRTAGRRAHLLHLRGGAVGAAGVAGRHLPLCHHLQRPAHDLAGRPRGCGTACSGDTPSSRMPMVAGHPSAIRIPWSTAFSPSIRPAPTPTGCVRPGGWPSGFAKLGVASVIAGDDQKHVRTAVYVISSALHAPPHQIGGVWLWRCTRSRTDRGLPLELRRVGYPSWPGHESGRPDQPPRSLDSVCSDPSCQRAIAHSRSDSRLR